MQIVAAFDMISFKDKQRSEKSIRVESRKNCSKKVSYVEIAFNFRPEPRLTVYRQITGAYNCVGVATRERACVWNFFADFESFAVTLEHDFVSSFCPVWFFVWFFLLFFCVHFLAKWFVVNFVNLIFE